MKIPLFKKKTLFLIAISLPMTGCECVQSAEGLILDRDTRLPVENVLYYRDEITYGVEYSDSTGKFNYNGGLAGGAFGCPNITLYFYKKGYKPVKVTYKAFSKNDTVLLGKQNE